MACHTYSQSYYITEPELSRSELLPELTAQRMKTSDKFDGTVSRVSDLLFSGHSRLMFQGSPSPLVWHMR